MKSYLRKLPDTDIGVSPFSSTADIEAAYIQIEEEIGWLEAAIRAWKDRRNSLSIIAKLPPELLSTVFKYVAAAFTCRMDFKWVKVTHICSHWRRVALECPSLWTTIHLSPPKWAEEMLERSKSASLNIVAVISDYTSRRVPLLKTILTRMSQIERLSISYHRSNRKPIDKLLGSIVSPAPLLEGLHLHFTDQASVHILPEHVFSGQAPRLRVLELHNSSLFWRSPLLHGLTTLKVTSIPRAARPSMTQLMGALSNMPNLQVLHLRETILTDTTAAVGSGFERLVPLPRLTHINIESDISECTFLLNHLIYPSNVLLTLLCAVPYYSADKQCLSRNFPSLCGLGQIFFKSQPIRHLHAIYHKAPKVIQLVVLDTPRTCSKDLRDSYHVDVTLLQSKEMFYPTHGDIWADFLQMLWTSIPMMDLETLCVDARWRDVVWSHIFDGLSSVNLKKLAVQDHSGIGFLQAFSLDDPAPQAEQSRWSRPLKLASLRELAIERWQFDEVVEGKPCSELLQLWLKDRCKHGAAITELFLTNCKYITRFDVDKLKQIVEVTWDGRSDHRHY